MQKEMRARYLTYVNNPFFAYTFAAMQALDPSAVNTFHCQTSATRVCEGCLLGGIELVVGRDGRSYVDWKRLIMELKSP